MEPKQSFYETQAKTIIKQLEKRRMEGRYCPTREDALNKSIDALIFCICSNSENVAY